MTTTFESSHEISRFCLDRGLVDLVKFKQAETQSKVSGRSIYEVLISLGSFTDAQVKEAVAKYLDLPQIPLASILEQSKKHLEVFPKAYAVENRIVPFDVSDKAIKVAIAEPNTLRSISSVRLITGKSISAYIVSPLEMEELLQAVQDEINKNVLATEYGVIPKTVGRRSFDIANYLAAKELEKHKKNTAPQPPVGGASQKTSAELKAELQDDHGGKIISFVNNMIFDAVAKGASDIHIETYKEQAIARFRIDGVLQERTELHQFLFSNYPAITTRLKIMASLDISERRLPQDGAIVIKLQDGREVDLRVSILPTIYGERVVMRILDRDGISFDLDKLGFPDKEYKDVLSAFEASQGMILVTGPTGSGKSTTLYGGLKKLNKPGVNILTAEDPVEYTIDGVGQVQIRDDIGLTFAAALRSFLRQDPEVILVGEIRDKDTADISIKAALTGHLVLSTLHANDAISTIVRLVNMGIPGYLIGAALTLIIAQRLTRKICPHCKQVHEGDHEAILLDLGFSLEQARNAKIYKGVGCAKCNNIGYKGRQGIYEVLKINEVLRTAIIEECTATRLKEIAEENGFRTMQEIGREMVLNGTLTIDEYQSNLVFH